MVSVKAPPAKTAPSRSSWSRHIALAALLLCVCAAYSNSLRAGLLFDSDWVIQGDSRVQAATAENVKLIFTEDYLYRNSTSGVYRPFTTLTYLFNYAILGGGGEVAGYHLVNLALHLINISLLYAFGLIAFRHRGAAIALAALWGLHPVLTESVTNIVGRADLLAGFGVLAALLAHTRYSGAVGRTRLKWLAAVGLATAIGLFSKESAAIVPAVLFLYDVASADGAGLAGLLRRRWPSYAAAAVPFVLYFYLRAHALSHGAAMPVVFTDNPIAGASFPAGRLTAVKVIGQYLCLLLWPATLSCDYSFNQVPLFDWNFAAIETWKALAALLLSIAAVAAMVLCYRKRRLLSFFIAFFLVSLAPTSNLLIAIGSIKGERFLYLPAIGFIGCVVWLFHAVWPLPRGATYALFAVLAVALASRTYARNSDWLDDLSLWSSAVEAAPGSYKTHLHLAAALPGPKGERMDQAIAEADRSLAILAPLPDDRSVPQAYASAGYYYFGQGNRTAVANAAESRRWFERARDILLRGERVDRAVAAQILAINRAQGRNIAVPGWYPLYLVLGDTWMRLGEPAKAIEAYEQGRLINPIPEFFEGLYMAHGSAGDTPRAIISLIEGVLADQNSTPLAQQLIAMYRQTDPGCAVETIGSAVRPNLLCPLVHDQFCAASRNLNRLFVEMGQPDAAQAIASRAAREFGCGAPKPVAH